MRGPWHTVGRGNCCNLAAPIMYVIDRYETRQELQRSCRKRNSTISRAGKWQNAHLEVAEGPSLTIHIYLTGHKTFCMLSHSFFKNSEQPWLKFHSTTPKQLVVQASRQVTMFIKATLFYVRLQRPALSDGDVPVQFSQLCVWFLKYSRPRSSSRQHFR